jgi:environmental stress-induced protein Ves
LPANGTAATIRSSGTFGRYAGDARTLSIIEQVLSKAGVEFIDKNGGGPGVRLRKGVQKTK